MRTFSDKIGSECAAPPDARTIPETIKGCPATSIVLQNILIRIYFIETDRVSHFYKCHNLHVHSMTFALARYTENIWLFVGSRGRLVRVPWMCSIELFGGRTSELSVCLMDVFLLVYYMYYVVIGFNMVGM